MDKERIADHVAQEVAQTVARSVAKKVAIGIALLMGFIVFIIAGGFVVRLLWNWLMPDIFGLREITFLEGLGLLALSRIMFGGFGSGGGMHDRRRHHRADWWKKAPEKTEQAPERTDTHGTAQ